jgi:hypothetical protein
MGGMGSNFNISINSNAKLQNNININIINHNVQLKNNALVGTKNLDIASANLAQYFGNNGPKNSNKNTLKSINPIGQLMTTD